MNKGFLLLVFSSFFLVTSCASFRGSLVSRDIAAEYYAIGEGYAALSKYDQAIPYYQKAARQKEFENASLYGLGRMYALSGKWSSACDVFSGLYDKDPENELISSAYAFALVSDGKNEKALALYETIYKKKSDDPDVVRNYAEMQVVAGKFSEALETIEILKTQFPDSDALKGLDVLEKKANDGLNPPPEPPPPADGKGAKSGTDAKSSPGSATGADKK